MSAVADAPAPPVHLLVVDDHDEQRSALVEILRDPAYRVLTAASGDEALRQLLAHDVAVVLLDVRMPGMDGFETAGLIRRRAKTRETPILFLTAGDLSPKESAEAAAVGAADYITKPVDAVLLKSKVKAFVKLYLTRAKLEGLVDARTDELLRTNETLRREVEERRRTQEELRFLSDVSAALAGSLEFETTLRKIAELAVPALADWAAVDLLEDGGAVRRVALVHRDPAKLARARAYHDRRPVGLQDPHGIGAVLQTGEPEFTPWIPDLFPQAPTWDPEDRRLIEDLKLRSVMIVPLKGRERVLGAVSFITSESERRYGESDLAVALELGRRASLALENALLYRDLQRQLEQRRAAEQDLRSSEERFRNLVEGVEAIVWECDPVTWQFTYVSPQAERMLGYPLERWLREKEFWISILHPEDREAAVASCVGATRAGRNNDFEYRVVAADGRAVWIRDLVYVTMDGGRPKSLRGLMFDVTERRKSEQRLVLSHEVLENMAEGVSLSDASGRIVYTNPAEDRIFGYERGELIGRHVTALDADAPGQDDRIAEDVLRVLRETGVWQGEWANRRKDGTPFTTFARITAVRIAGLPYNVCVQEDITDRKRATETAAYLAAIVRSSNDAIVTLSLDGRIASWNEGAKTLYGYEAEEVVGRPVSLLVPEERQEEERPILAKIARGERVDHYVTVRRRKDGARVPVSLTASPVRDASGRVVGVSKIARDITDAKRAEREILELNQTLERRVEERTRQLQELVRELEGFAYTVAHDLRAPVRAMTGFAAILLEECRASLSGDAPEIARRIVDAGQRMDRLLQDLLAYSRLSRENLPLGPIALGDLLAKVLGELRGEIAQRKAEVVVHDGLPTVIGHVIPLSVALNNLLMNALKFVAPGTEPRIEVGVERRADGRVRLWVQDNGIGVAAEYHDKIFGVFERLHGQETYPGTGIGLALVRRAAERMGGTAGVHSIPGQGSRFYLDLTPSSGA